MRKYFLDRFQMSTIIPHIGLFHRKNPNRRGGCLRVWNFQGYLKERACGGISPALGLIQNQVEFTRMTRGWTLFCLEFPRAGKVKKKKNSTGGGVQKSLSSTPVWIFSGIAHFWSCQILIKWKWKIKLYHQSMKP